MRTSNIIYTLLGFFLVIAFLFFIFKISIHYPNSMKDVKITDWLSVVFNFIMASLAILGVFYARNWRESLTESKTLEEATSLKYKVLTNANRAFYILTPSGIQNYLPDHKNSPVFDGYNTEGLFNSFHDMCNDLDCVRDAIYELNASRERLVFFGWDLCADKKNEFIKVDKSVDELYKSRFKLEYIINTALSSHGMVYDGSYSFPIYKLNRNKADLDDLIKILNGNFVTSEKLDKFAYILKEIMNIRNSSLNSIKVLKDCTDTIHDLIEPINIFRK